MRESIFLGCGLEVADYEVLRMSFRLTRLRRVGEETGSTVYLLLRGAAGLRVFFPILKSKLYSTTFINSSSKLPLVLASQAPVLHHRPNSRVLPSLLPMSHNDLLNRAASTSFHKVTFLSEKLF